MASTCWGADSSAPDEVLEGLRVHLEKHAPGREHIDEHDCCLLADLGGQRCPDGACAYDASGRKKENHTPHRPVKKPKPARRSAAVRKRKAAKPLVLATAKRGSRRRRR